MARCRTSSLARTSRRGFFVFKIAGAAADEGLSLEEVEHLSRRANAAVRSMGVALSPCSLPQTRRANFSIGADEMEVGMGIHGEPGVERTALETADAVAERLAGPVLDELALTAGDAVAVLVNGLGSTSQMELLILHRRVRQLLDARGCRIHASWVGEYVTSLEMAGASVSILKLDADLQRLLDRPCLTPALRVGEVPQTPAETRRRNPLPLGSQIAVRTDGSEPREGGGRVDPACFRRMLLAARDAMAAHEEELGRLDGAIGDGDHGVTMRTGWDAAAAAIGPLDDPTITELCEAVAEAFLGAVGASAGPLYASGFREAGRVVAHRRDLDGPSLATWIAGVADGIERRGEAKLGDKTMLDAWRPAAEAARRSDRDEAECLQAAARAAERGAASTTDMRAAKGRAAKLGERVLGHPDPGAMSAAILIRAMASVDLARDKASIT